MLPSRFSMYSSWLPLAFPSPSVVQLPVTYRFHQTAGAAVEWPTPGPGLAGHSEGHRPGSPSGAAAPATGRGFPRPGAAVDGWEAAVEFLAGRSSFQPQRGDGLRGPASAAGSGRGGGTWPGERAGGMASLEEGAQACHCQCLWTHKEHGLLRVVRPQRGRPLLSSSYCFQVVTPAWNSHHHHFHPPESNCIKTQCKFQPS